MFQVKEVETLLNGIISKVLTPVPREKKLNCKVEIKYDDFMTILNDVVHAGFKVGYMAGKNFFQLEKGLNLIIEESTTELTEDLNRIKYKITTEW
ncbi:MAG TPA: hypothetical protein PL110_15135 [Candidatus Eremiobacteraeota bacterium]|nr:MAG: hypothetical protein BWY64_00226 [bacterium ADurb.Bin363]HPZ09437.1 hypothetical protein [Candidatus Eremiobacteraeota bacterium]